MSMAHAFPFNEEWWHSLDTENCRCHPEILDEGLDDAGQPALVVVHNELARLLNPLN